jgi:asparagine synthase (glutamine-hydrolysing)
MTAIAGLWRFDGKPDVASDCGRMLAAQQIYGPHDGRQWSDGPIAMGRRLYHLLPEDAFDRQPVSTADGRLTLVADLRLDNREELAPALGWSLAWAADASDAGILLGALEHWGEGALDRVVGDFAFALWDAHAHTLTLARDFLGQRPLHYHRGNGFFAFSSMAKGLHSLSDVPYAPDEAAMAEFVALLPHAKTGSYFKDIARVEPGAVVTVTSARLTSRDYWTPARPPRTAAKGADYVEGLRHHLDQATKARLRGAGGTVASHLSAGFDSASVAATAARLMAPEGGKVVAFTSVPRQGWDGPSPFRRFGDEGPLAAATAAMHPNIEHVLIRAGRNSPVAALDRDFYLYERPILNLCNAVWSRAILKSAQDRGLAVMLTGQLGNMTLSYNGDELLSELLRQGRLLALLGACAKVLRHSERRWTGVLAQLVGPYAPAWLWQWVNRAYGRASTDAREYTAINAARMASIDLPRLARERHLDLVYRPRTNAFDTRVWVMRRSDGANYGKGALAGWGVDQRDPTADRRLVEYCLQVPTDEYLKDGVPRALGKAALADRLPDAVINQRFKGYQSADWYEGLTAARGDIATELDRLAAIPETAGLLDIDRLQTLVRDWPTEGWDRQEVITNYRLALLRGVSAGHFLRRASGSNQ